ncbi:MAG: hypothetical protein R8K20_03510 [Gallionellaceae bacterium]
MNIETLKQTINAATHRGDIYYLSGNANRELRRSIMESVTGQKHTLAQSGITALIQTLYKFADIQGNCGAVKQDNFEKWLNC